MTGFIGFDAERIAWLRDAMRRAHDELVRAESPDPAALPAATRLRRARSTLGDVWIPMLDRLIAEQLDAESASVMSLENGWGPLAAFPFWVGQRRDSKMTADQVERAASARDEARAVADAVELARILATSDVWELMTSDVDLDRLTERLLDIAAHAPAAATFISGFEGWQQLMSAVATEHASTEDRTTLDRDDDDAVGRLRRCDALIAALAAVIGGGSLDRDRPAHPDVFSEIDPYAAALLLPHLALSGQKLADAATQIVRRWHALPSGDVGWIDYFNNGENTIDLVFGELSSDREGAARFLDSAVDRPETIVMGARHAENMEQVLRLGTRFEGADPARVGAIVIPTIEWARNGWKSVGAVAPGSTMLSQAAFGDVLADWVLYFGPRAELWGWSYRDGDDALRWIIEDDEAMQRFQGGLLEEQRQLDTLEYADSERRVADHLITELTGMFAQLESAIADARYDDAVNDAFWIDLGFSAVKLVANRLIMPTAGGPAAFARDAVVSAAVSLAQRTLERQHIIPASPEHIAETTRRDSNERSVDRAVMATVTVVSQLVELGQIDASVLEELQLDDVSGDDCIAVTKADRLNDWVASLEPRLTPGDFNLVIAVRNGFLNQRELVGICR